MLNWGPNGAARARGRERGIGRASIDYGTTTDSYELQFARRLTAYANLVAVGERNGVPLAHFVFGIGPAETTPRRERRAASSYPVRVRRGGARRRRARRGARRHGARLPARPPARRGASTSSAGWSCRCRPAAGAGARRIEQGDDAGVVLPRDTRARRRRRALRSRSATWRSASGRGQRALAARPAATPVLLTPFDLFPERSELELYYEAARRGRRAPLSARDRGVPDEGRAGRARAAGRSSR